MIVAGLAGFPDELARHISGRNVEDLKRPTSDGGWGVIEVLGHLADWEEIFLSRAEAIVNQDSPRLPVYDDQLWEVEHDYRAQDPYKVLDRLRQTRQQLVALLADLTADAWRRTASIGSEADVTLDQLAQRIRQHDQDHLRAIAEALG